MFTFYSVYQMLEWAIKKHKNYKKEFGDKYPRGRKAMFPFIIWLKRTVGFINYLKNKLDLKYLLFCLLDYIL